MLPVVTTETLRLTNRTVDANGVYVIVGQDMVVLRLVIASSGNDTPLVQMEVDWGDGQKELSDFRSIGRSFQYQHAYANLGNYTVTVRAINTDSEISAITSNTTIPLRVVIARAPERQGAAKWSGLALPAKSIRQAYSVSQDVALPIFVGLASTGLNNSRTIYVDGSEVQFTNGSQVIITQPGRKITAARVLDREGNLITLDATLLDTYDPASSETPALVELRRQSIVRDSTIVQTQTEPWFFPISRDKDLIRASIRMAFTTRLKERVMLPEYGSRLPEVPFEPNDDLTFDVLRSEMQRVVNRWEPRAQVSRVSLTRDGNEITGRCICQLADNVDAFELDFTVNADR